MTLDADTLYLLALIVGLELSLVLVLIGRLLRGQPGLRHWALGMASAAVGGLAVGVPGEISTLVGSGLGYLGFGLSWVGARDYFARPRPLWPMWAGLVVVELAAAVLQVPESAVRAVCVAGACWSGAIAWTFLRNPPGRVGIGSRVAGSLFALLGVLLLVKALLPPAGEAGPPVWQQTAEPLGAIFFGIAWVFVVVGLASHRILTRLRDAARSDGLTGLLNRRALREDGGGVIELCRRKGRPCAVLLADLDRFKGLNDTHGHAAGDAALRQFASIAAASASPGDVVARWGGEEFCFVLPGASRERALRMAEKLRGAIARSPIPLGDRSLPLTVSVGVAWAKGPDLVDLKQLLERADEALYRAKEDGRDRVREAA
ncbi:sensor domain-containing diguanylate cyclase [Vulgatibacter incomptus]|uniref:diguanylate cyclase n=1 Tax=Vulgatibacter incomptus TaxID=1391653 RepID=A0A0K1PFU7_9BACT|nr:GGDEF domain-containing protein [Vulgatibacter incomptus]AKU91989.1 diguanylate cyclase/phosphodiesterase (GGDEF & EAL domains) with PAS/PAC sensor(s) [Vulgatibacter incomptus]